MGETLKRKAKCFWEQQTRWRISASPSTEYNSSAHSHIRHQKIQEESAVGGWVDTLMSNAGLSLLGDLSFFGNRGELFTE